MGFCFVLFMLDLYFVHLTFISAIYTFLVCQISFLCLMLSFTDLLWLFAVRGYKRFYRRTALETSDYLKDDCLVMNCTVGVVRNRIETSRQFSIPVPPPDMGKCLKELLESGMGSDIVFEVGDETFKAHKQILAARSPVFNAQFFGLIGDPNMDRVVVQDVEPPVFKVMIMQLLILPFIYVYV